MKQTFIISLGGSIINPGEVDTTFLKQFKGLIEREVKRGHKFIIITGGGTVCRKYQAALKELIPATKDELDWMGIFATRFNGNLVRLLFRKLAHPKVIDDPHRKVVFNEKIMVAAGGTPGWSTDYDAVVLGKAYGAQTIINLSNIDYLYTKDPRKFPDATKIESISWKDFRKMVGNTWNPGANVPFDPIASKHAEKNKQCVIIANGKNLENLQNILEEKKFVGTLIQ